MCVNTDERLTRPAPWPQRSIFGCIRHGGSVTLEIDFLVLGEEHNAYDNAVVRSDGNQQTVSCVDVPEFRGGNPYFFSENLYQPVDFIDALRHFSCK